MRLFFLSMIIFISCNNMPKKDSSKLCTEFYQLNKGKSFDYLFDVTIGTSRVQSIYDENLNKYDLMFKTIGIYDVEAMGYVTVPIFNSRVSESEFDSTFQNFNQQTKDLLSVKLGFGSQKKLFTSYIDFIDRTLEQYYKIETPKWYSGKNVIVEGNPTLGKFITFTLNDKCNCYYLKDPNSLSQYWFEYFKKLNKLDSNWFYEAKNSK